MLLLDAAQVETGGANWTLGGEEIDRSCGLEVILSDYCGTDPAGGVIIEPNSAGGAMPYRTLPFGIIGRLRRSTACIQSDDEAWLRDAMQQVTEQAVARALTVQSVFGTEAWVGADGVTEIEGPDGDAGRTLGAAICEARTEWSNHNVGTPLLHISPCGLLELAQDGAVVIQEGKIWSIWGDQIVSSPGYAETPVAFLTGPITVHLSTIESEDMIAASRNRATVEANRVGLIELAPCSIIRIGPASDPLEPPPAPATVRVDITDQHATAHVDNAHQGEAGVIDWGDGYTDRWVQTSDDPEPSPTVTHTYATGGSYSVTMRPGGGSVPVEIEEPVEPPPGEAKPTLGIEDFEVLLDVPTEYETTLTNREGESQECTSHIVFTVDDKELTEGDIVWEEEGLLGDDEWETREFDPDGYGGLESISAPYPVANPLDGRTTCRITAQGQLVGGDVIHGRSEVLSSSGVVLASATYDITVNTPS